MNALAHLTSRPLEPIAHRPLGLLDFDRVLRPATVRTPTDALRICLTEFPEAFQEAAIAISPAAWRLLLSSTRFDWVLLIDSSIDFRGKLREAAETGHDVPPDWLGGNDPQDIAASLRQDLAYMDEDAARAAWLVLSFVKSLRLDVSEVIHIVWWKPQWLRHALQGNLIV